MYKNYNSFLIPFHRCHLWHLSGCISGWSDSCCYSNWTNCTLCHKRVYQTEPHSEPRQKWKHCRANKAASRNQDTHRPSKTAQIVQPYTPLHLVQTNLTQVTINHVYRHTTRKPTHSRASNKLHRTATATSQERRRKPSPPLTLLTYLLVFRHKKDNFPRT